MSLTSDPVRLGVAGLGRAFALTAPAMAAHPGIRLVAAAAPRPDSRAAFTAAFGGRTYDDVPAMATDPEVEAIYICTPHALHLPHALAAIAAGKHVLVEKPITVSLEDATTLIEAAKAANVTVVVGPSHSFDGPVAAAAALIAKGRIGAVRMIHALYATDFLYRPRRGDEMKTDLGGGVVFSQAIHQIDVVRRLMQRPARTVMALTGGIWDPGRPTESGYGMLMAFEGGAFATLAYSGHGHFDGDRLMGDVSELGTKKDAIRPTARQALRAAFDEAEAKRARGFQSLATCPHATTHEHFGQVLIFGERGDLRLTPFGVEVSDADGVHFHTVPFRTTRAEVLDALIAALRDGKTPLQGGAWGRASLEICHALLRSAAMSAPVPLHLQESV